ncbi:MAG TPA: hypothetical protein VJ901_02465 [Thermoanaerobaculia bacterium]|nr:hypothetical protein [Thermoanaerobaculia bacterium]
MIEFTEDRMPAAGIEETIAELVDLYGGKMREERENAREFTLPLRRGVATAGAVECTVSWAVAESGDATVTLRCDRDVDAPKAQRVAMLLIGVIGALMFMMWPFAYGTQYGTLAWIGGAVAIAVYFLTLKRTSGGLAYDFLQRLAQHQRVSVMS